MMNSRRSKNFAEKLAWFLDDWFVIPGTQIRFGFDGIIGLLPGIGDTLTSFLSLLIVTQAAAQGAPLTVLLRMVGNVILDLMVGWIPGLGDFFDFFWKSNRRNIAILREYETAPRQTQTRSRAMVALVGLVFLTILTSLGYLIIQMVGLVWNWLQTLNFPPTLGI